MDALKKLELIKRNYSKDLPLKFHEINKLFNEAKKDTFTKESLNTLYRLVHNLVGSGATFGLLDVSNAARELANALEKYIDNEKFPQESDLKNLNFLIYQLSKVCIFEEIKSNDDEIEPLKLTLLDNKTLKEYTKIIYILSNDKNILEELRTELEDYGYAIKLFFDIKSFEKTMEEKPVDVVLIDADIQNENTSGIQSKVKSGMQSIIKMKKKIKKEFKIIYMSSNGDFFTRVLGVQAHSDGFITKPIDIRNLIKQLEKFTKKNLYEPIRALLLDDEESLNEYHASILNSANIQTKCISDPELILNVMSDFRPEILITDLYMPKYDGQEVVKVIRQMDEYLSVPILFLSIENRDDILYNLMGIGSEYFLQKPVDKKNFVQVVKTRALRYRNVREMIQLDGLTNLYNHSTIIALLEKELSNAKRYNYPLSFAMLDLDFFKKVNDTYGHQAGDIVLQSLARVIKTRVRNSDFIGRYGGEEFCVILPHTNIESAFNVLESIRKAFSNLNHSFSNKKFNVTLSSGICEYNNSMDISKLINCADEALYKAKNSGKNRTYKA